MRASALNAADEPPLDRSRDHLLEAHALERALALADDAALRARLQALANHRETLMRERAAFDAEAIRLRHARGEIYSAARIAALNAMVPSAEDLAEQARTLYERAEHAVDVLKTHACVHYVYVLMGARLNLVHFPADVIDAGRAMQRAEEAFAKAWLACIDDPGFLDELRRDQRAALNSLRTATRPMYLATQPRGESLDDEDAAVLGRAWNKLDDLAATLGVEPLSAFVAVPGEDAAAAVPAARVAATVDALHAALREPKHKLPAKKATLASLERVSVALEALVARDGGAWFEVDL
ncbi:MAG: hypothetical protein AB7P42_22000 [Gammaproteobacteria bacterium]